MPNPIGKGLFRNSALSQSEDFSDDFSIGGREFVAIHTKKRNQGKEPDALVTVAVRMVSHEPKRVGGGERRNVSPLGVMPLLLRPRQR